MISNYQAAEVHDLDKREKSLTHYLYILFLILLDIWLVRSVVLEHYSPDSPVVSLVIFFTILNILFGIKEVIILDNGIEKRYRFNFIINLIALLTCGPLVAYMSILIASLFYIPVNQFRRLGKVDIPSVFLHVLSLTISLNVMSLLFFQLGGQVFEPNFPYNVLAVLVGAIANFAVNTLVFSIWIYLYNFNTNLFRLIRKEFLWLLKYDLWQAIYAILIVNTVRLYFGDIYQQYTHGQSNIGSIELIILTGIIVVAFIFYYPIKERLVAFNLLINFKRQNADLTQLSHKLKQTNKRVIRAFISMLEKRDPYTSGHSERVALYSKTIARKLQLGESRCEMLEMAALLHDIGKMGVDINIINKQERLTDEEYDEIKKHPDYGVEILERIYRDSKQSEDYEFKLICDIANSHHERYDGKGYPKGISGEDISLEARIIGVADAIDAMTSDRPYRAGMTMEQALEELRKGCGTQFCPRVVEAVISYAKDNSLKIEKDSDISKMLSVFS